jgi:hypothetical protein
VSCAGYAEPHFDIRYFSIEFTSRLFAIAKFTPRFYTVWAMTSRWIFRSNPAVHSHAHSEAVICPRVLRFSA